MKYAAYIKLLYLYLCYWLVGMTEEGFQYQKALYLSELGYYHPAIHALKKAEEELKAGYLYGLLGWCYIQVEAFDKALEYYKKAYQSEESPSIILGLAVSELHAGSLAKYKDYFQRLAPYRDDPVMAECLANMESEYARRIHS